MIEEEGGGWIEKKIYLSIGLIKKRGKSSFYGERFLKSDVNMVYVERVVELLYLRFQGKFGEKDQNLVI